VDFLWDDDSSAVQQQKKGLMVEKECVFKPVFLDEFCENVNSMLMTTQGYSDEQSRAFLKYFSQYHNIKIQALTDMGQEGASIIASCNNKYVTRPFAPHFAYNINLGWIGMNDRFMRNAFPNHTYHQTSTGTNDNIINNKLLDTDCGFVTTTNPSDRRVQQVTRLLSTEAVGTLDPRDAAYNPKDPRGRKADIDVLDEKEVVTAVTWFMNNPGMES